MWVLNHFADVNESSPSTLTSARTPITRRLPHDGEIQHIERKSLVSHGFSHCSVSGSRRGISADTGLWYHRLCRALANQSVVGSLSRRLGGIETAVASDVVASVVELPPTIEMVSLRELGWPMGDLASRGIRLNLLSLEAVAAARHLGSDICLAAADDNKPLVDAARSLDIPVRRLATTGLAPAQPRVPPIPPRQPPSPGRRALANH